MAFTKWVRICEESEKAWNDYLASLDKMTPAELVREFFSYLDYVEYRGEDNSPRKYITISCGRVMMAEPLAEVMQRMRKLQ